MVRDTVRVWNNVTSRVRVMVWFWVAGFTVSISLGKYYVGPVGAVGR